MISAVFPFFPEIHAATSAASGVSSPAAPKDTRGNTLSFMHIPSPSHQINPAAVQSINSYSLPPNTYIT